MTDLKPCPFCGGEAEINVKYGDYGYTPHVYFVRCKHCGVKMEMESNSYNDLSNAVVIAWNRRVGEQE